MKKRWLSCVVVAAGAAGCSQSASEDELGIGRAEEPILRAEAVPEDKAAGMGVVGLLRTDDREEYADLTGDPPSGWTWRFEANGTLLADSGQRWVLTNAHLVSRSVAHDGSECVEPHAEPVANDLDSMEVYVGGYRSDRAHPPQASDQLSGFAKYSVTHAMPFGDVDRMMEHSGCLPVTDVALVRSEEPLAGAGEGHDLFSGDSDDLDGTQCDAISFGPFVYVAPDERPPGIDNDYFVQHSSGTLRHAEFPVLGVVPSFQGSPRHKGSMWVIDRRSLLTDVVPSVGDSGHSCFRQNKIVGVLSAFRAEEGDADCAYHKTEVFRDWVKTILFEAGSRDVTGDEQADVAVAHQITGDLDVWTITRPRTEPDDLAAASAPSPTGSPHWVDGAGWTPRGIGDFDENRRGDFVYQAIGVGGGWDEGLVYVLSLLGLGVSDWEVIRPPYDLSYELQAVADLDGDGISDLIWRNPTNGKNYYWTIAPFDHNRPPEQAVKASKSFQVLAGADWRIVAVADFDRYEILTEPPELEGALTTRSTPDVLWQNTSTGELRLWLMDWWYGTYGRRQSLTLPVPTPGTSWSANWRVVSVGDYNLDGHTDLLAYCSECEPGGQLRVWARKAPDGGLDAARPRFEFVETCAGALSYRARVDVTRLNDPNNNDFIPGNCTDRPDCYDTRYPEAVVPTHGIADCTMEELPSDAYPVTGQP